MGNAALLSYLSYLAETNAWHCLLFDDMPIWYIIKKDIKFFAPLSFKKAVKLRITPQYSAR